MRRPNEDKNSAHFALPRRASLLGAWPHRAWKTGPACRCTVRLSVVTAGAAHVNRVWTWPQRGFRQLPMRIPPDAAERAFRPPVRVSPARAVAAPRNLRASGSQVPCQRAACIAYCPDRECAFVGEISHSVWDLWLDYADVLEMRHRLGDLLPQHDVKGCLAIAPCDVMSQREGDAPKTKPIRRWRCNFKRTILG